jgi:hypothetical protein
MNRKTRHELLLEAQLKKNGWVAHLINRGEQVKYFDGRLYVEGEVTWSWREQAGSGELPTAVPPLHIHADTLYVVNPPELRRELTKSEKKMISERIREAFLEQGTESVIEGNG